MRMPECQMSDCEADATQQAEHPEHGQVSVCQTCASLFEIGVEA